MPRITARAPPIVAVSVTGTSRMSNRPSALPRWTTRTQNLRDALITLDGRRAGASYREIATVLYGAKTVAEDWHKGLKERMHRHFKRGAKLSDGGYRDFLR